MKFALAFDIDGTCCMANSGWVPGLLQACRDMHANSGQLIFVTGRTTAWSLHFLKALEVPFKLGALNGAELSEFPSGKLLESTYISSSFAEDLLKRTKAPVIIYTKNSIFYRPAIENTSFENHLENRRGIQKESWRIYEPGVISHVLAIRIFMFTDEAEAFAKEELSEVNVSLMRDSFNSNVRIAQITGRCIDKGYSALQLAGGRPFIAFGDDHNDVPLFRKAHLAYAVTGAPQELTALARRTINRDEIPKIVQGLIKE